MSTRLMVAVAGSVLAWSALATAQDSGVVYERETSYDFEDDYVEGQLVSPDGDLVGATPHGKQSQLIRIRQDFIPEMVKSVEQL